VSKENGIDVANAPVSYGAFEVTVGMTPTFRMVLSCSNAIACGGYDGIDLGPVGYLGTGADLGRRLAERGLGLAGAYIEFTFHDAERVTSLMPELDAMFVGHLLMPSPRSPAPPPHGQRPPCGKVTRDIRCPAPRRRNPNRVDERTMGEVHNQG